MPHQSKQYNPTVFDYTENFANTNWIPGRVRRPTEVIFKTEVLVRYLENGWEIRRWTWTHRRSDRKPSMGFRLAPWSLTLDDLDCPSSRSLKCTSNTSKTVYKMYNSNIIVQIKRSIERISRLFMYFFLFCNRLGLLSVILHLRVLIVRC